MSARMSYSRLEDCQSVDEAILMSYFKNWELQSSVKLIVHPSQHLSNKSTQG